MRYSSIFTAETLTERPRFTRAAILALCVCAGVRVLFWLFAATLELIPQEDLDYGNLVANQLHLRELSRPSPRLLVVGTSRLWGLSAVDLDRRLRMEPSDIFCSVFIGGSFWAECNFLRRNPHLTAHTQMALFEVLPCSLFPPSTFPDSTQGFLRFSNLQDKLLLNDPWARTQALVDLLFPIWSARNTVFAWRVFFQELGTPPLDRSRVFLILADAMRAVFDAADISRADHDRAIIASQAPYPKLSSVREAALKQTLALLPNQCSIVFLFLPVRGDFQQMALEDPIVRQSLQNFKERLEALDDPRVSVEWEEDQAVADLHDEDYIDPGHFTQKALKTKVADLIADVIREHTASLPVSQVSRGRRIAPE